MRARTGDICVDTGRNSDATGFGARAPLCRGIGIARSRRKGHSQPQQGRHLADVGVNDKGAQVFPERRAGLPAHVLVHGGVPEPDLIVITDFELTVFRYEDFVADPIGQTGILAKVLGVDAEQARIEEIVAAASPDSMREREKNGKNGIDPKFNFIGPAKVGNWKQLQSGDDRDAIMILEEFARDAMQRGGYESSAEAMGQL